MKHILGTSRFLKLTMKGVVSFIVINDTSRESWDLWRIKLIPSRQQFRDIECCKRKILVGIISLCTIFCKQSSDMWLHNIAKSLMQDDNIWYRLLYDKIIACFASQSMVGSRKLRHSSTRKHFCDLTLINKKWTDSNDALNMSHSDWSVICANQGNISTIYMIKQQTQQITHNVCTHLNFLTQVIVWKVPCKDVLTGRGAVRGRPLWKNINLWAWQIWAQIWQPITCSFWI